jgi:hypothetical protein
MPLTFHGSQRHERIGWTSTTIAMMLSPAARKLVLTVHVTVTLGWLGAVVVFLALSVIGLTSAHPETVRGAYLVMEPTAWFVLVPLAVASLLSGLVQSLGTAWGLIRHYWIVFKLALTVLATVVLLAYMETFRLMAAAAGDPTAELDMVRNPSPLLHSVLALMVLLSATVLGIYKPRGETPFGRRKSQERLGQRAHGGEGHLPSTMSTPRWVKISAIIGAIILVKFIVLEIARH